MLISCNLKLKRVAKWPCVASSNIRMLAPRAPTTASKGIAGDTTEGKCCADLL